MALRACTRRSNRQTRFQHESLQRGGLGGVAKRMKGTAGRFPPGARKQSSAFVQKRLCAEATLRERPFQSPSCVQRRRFLPARRLRQGAKCMKGTAGAIPSGSKKAIVSLRAKASLRRGGARERPFQSPSCGQRRRFLPGRRFRRGRKMHEGNRWCGSLREQEGNRQLSCKSVFAQRRRLENDRFKAYHAAKGDDFF